MHKSIDPGATFDVMPIRTTISDCFIIGDIEISYLLITGAMLRPV